MLFKSEQYPNAYLRIVVIFPKEFVLIVFILPCIKPNTLLLRSFLYVLKA